jgi:hypothetical protein
MVVVLVTIAVGRPLGLDAVWPQSDVGGPRERHNDEPGPDHLEPKETRWR